MRALCLAFLLCGCGDDPSTLADAAPPDAVPSPCPGAIPAIEDCFTGAFFAECGGVEEARLGCHPQTYDCKWFIGGCVADGYIASTCAPDMICCHADWPYADEELFDADVTLYLGFYALGTEPWDRGREMNVTVAVDPAVGAPPLDVTCTGTPPSSGANPCDAPETLYAVRRAADTLIFDIGDATADFTGWTLGIEIDPETPAARACVLPFTDAAPRECPGNTPICATSGTVMITSLTGEPVGIELDLTFPDGFHVQATLTE